MLETTHSASTSDCCNRAQFWGAVSILIEKPHILNRRLCGIVDLWWGAYSSPSCTASESHPGEELTGDGCGAMTVDDQQTLFIESEHHHKNITDNDIFSCSTEERHINEILYTAWKLLQNSSLVSEVPHSNDAEIVNFKENHKQAVSNESNKCLSDESNDELLLENMKTLLRNNGFNDMKLNDKRFQPWPTLTQGSTQLYAVLRRALPKQQHRFKPALELIFIDGRAARCSFLSRVSTLPLLPVLPYHLQHRERCIVLQTQAWGPHGPGSDGMSSDVIRSDGVSSNDVHSNSISSDGVSSDVVSSNCISSDGVSSDGWQWLQQTVLQRVAKWALQTPENGDTGSGGSLSRVDLQAYSALYYTLKTKYATQLVQNWQERTDPRKFVHEDIGIATYILLVWSRLKRPQRFLDLGCGNGLLVYILTGEGHSGQGLDIKKRKIWDSFPDRVDLQERVVRPCDSCLDPNVDWLLGNHSDELTPWIPVMAARTSYTCSFFVLPCCPHDFTAVFLRRNSGISQYADYLNYVEEVGAVCGFQMERDRLKIPSTKRVCFVGQTRTYAPEEWPAVLNKIQNFIDLRVQHYVNHEITRKNGSALHKVKEVSQPLNKIAQLAKDDGANNAIIVSEIALETDTAVTSQNHLSTITNVSLHSKVNIDSTSALLSASSVASHSTLVEAPSSSLDHANYKKTQDAATSAVNSGSGMTLWSAGFVARPREQRVRNCTQLKQEVKEELVRAVVATILKSEDWKQKSESVPWQSGTTCPLNTVATSLGRRRLEQLKQECGGLQTLLRNHRHIFVVERGTVRLRTPATVTEDSKRHRPCWFFSYHPQGCPNTATSCIYDHLPQREDIKSLEQSVFAT